MVVRDLVASVFETKVTRRIPLVDQKLLTLLGQLMSTFFVAFLLLNITFFYVVFVDQHLSFCPISLGHYIFVILWLIYVFWLPLWYLQTFIIWHVELFTLLYFSDAAFVNVDINFRNIGYNKISFVSNKTFENLPQLTSL